MRYSNYKVFILFTDRSGRWPLFTEHQWTEQNALVKAEHSWLFLPLPRTYWWSPCCALWYLSYIVESAIWDPTVVVWKRCQNVAQHRGSWTRIWLWRLEDYSYLARSYKINSNLWNLYLTLNMGKSSITVTLEWNNQPIWYIFNPNSHFRTENVHNSANHPTLICTVTPPIVYHYHVFQSHFAANTVYLPLLQLL